MPEASLTVNHGGHGSVAALAHGVPRPCIPGVGADQPVIVRRVEAFGPGQMISADTSASQLRDAATKVLATASCRQAAQRLAGALANATGVANAASALESRLQTSHPWSGERLALSHISRVFRSVARFARFWRCPAKPLADCLLVFAPVVGQHSLVGAERRPVSGPFLNVAAEVF